MKKQTISFIVVPLITLVLVAAGGWWASQAGLLGKGLSAAAQTASYVTSGVEAQPLQTSTLTSTVPLGAGAPGAFPAPPDGQAPGLGTGSAPASTEDSSNANSSNGASVDAVSEAATATVTSETATTTTSRVVIIPAIAGVKGSQLYDEGGAWLVTLESGASVLVTGRSADSTWLSVTTDAGDGWIQATHLIVYGLHRLPVAELPAAVLPAAVQAAATNVANATADVADTTGIAASDTLTIAAAAGSVATADTSGTSPAVTDSATTDLLTAGSVTTLVATVSTDQGRLNIRSGPGTNYSVVAKGEDGATYTVTGRNDAGDWLQLQLDNSETGWASAAYLKAAGDVSALPVRLAPIPLEQANASEPVDTSASSAAPVSIINIANYDTASMGDLQGIIVFQQSPGGMIYAYDLQTGKLWQLTYGFDPAISPDGSTVAFVRDGGEMGLYLINIDGRNERRIFERSVLSSPKWSPDGQWIVFSRNDEGVDCYQMMPNYCMLPEEAKDRFPMGIPDTIALVTEYQHKLSAVDSSGGNFHDIAALNSARAVDWSDAGIVYQSSAGIQITADGEDAVNREVIFDNLNPYYFDPDLQPGGGQIVFQIKGAAQTELWVVNTDGTGKTALTRPRTTLVDTLPSNVAAAYSPDGQHIVFLSNRSADNNAGDWHLWVMNADGSNQRQLPIDMAIDYTYGLDQVVSWGA